MFCMSSYVKELKKYAKNKTISDEEFVRALFDTENGTLGIKNRKGDYIDFDKCRISRILSQKEDVPIAMKKALTEYNAEQEIEDCFSDFCSEYIDEKTLGIAAKDIYDIISTDDTLPLPAKERLFSYKKDPIKLLSSAFVEAVKVPNKNAKEDTSQIWRKGVNTVSVIPGDLFKYGFENRSKKKNIVVIPVNTSFDTHITTKLETETNPLVSVSTVHGQWLLRYEKSGKSISGLDSRIFENIKSQEIQPIGKSVSANAKPDVYPIGTIAVVDEPKAYYYLLAISTFNEKNVAHSTKEDIYHAIKSLLRFYDENGQGYPLYLPLIGTGRSRTGMSLQESFDLIVSALKQNENLIQGSINIVIRTQDYKSLHIEWR